MQWGVRVHHPSASLTFRFSLTDLQGMGQFEMSFWSAGEIDGLRKFWLFFSCTTGVLCSDSLDSLHVLPFLLSFCIPACSYLPCAGPSCISIILSLELDGVIQSTALIFYFILVDGPLSM